MSPLGVLGSAANVWREMVLACYQIFLLAVWWRYISIQGTGWLLGDGNTRWGAGFRERSAGGKYGAELPCSPGPVYKGTDALIFGASGRSTRGSTPAPAFLQSPVLCSQHGSGTAFPVLLLPLPLHLEYNINLQLLSHLLLLCPSLQGTGLSYRVASIWFSSIQNQN